MTPIEIRLNNALFWMGEVRRKVRLGLDVSDDVARCCRDLEDVRAIQADSLLIAAPVLSMIPPSPIGIGPHV